MSEEAKNANTVNVSVPRSALFAAGGAVLVGLGVAAGMMLRSPSHTSADNQAAATETTQQAAASAPNTATNTATGGAITAKEEAGKTAESHPSHKQHEGHHQADAAMQSNGPAGGLSPDVETRPAVACANCGVIEAVRAVQQKGQGSGLGAVAGGVLGGVVGNQMGKGGGKTAMTVLGAIGGGLAGNEIEKQQRTVTVYEVRVRMDDGTVRTFTQSSEPAPGTRVQVDGRGFHAIDASSDTRPSTIQTSGSGGV